MSTNPIQIIPRAWYLLSRRERLWLMAGKKCHWCGVPTSMDYDHGWEATTIDHVIPRYKGGSKGEENCVASCNRCNNRRNHEDISGLPEGALLGKYKLGSTVQSTNANNPKLKHVALTKDEKAKIMASGSVVAKKPAAQNHLEQRDQALNEIKRLREMIDAAQIIAKNRLAEMNTKDTEIQRLKNRLDSMTVLDLMRGRIARWLLK